MHGLNYCTALVLAAIYYTVAAPRVVIQKERELVKDPRGLMHTDLEFIKRGTAGISWTPSTTIAEVAYAQGQADLIQFIERQVIGRRTD